MKKTLLILLVAVLSAATASAQLKFGVKAGFNASNITNLPSMQEEMEAGDYSNNYKPGFQIGVAAQYLLTPQFGIETGLYYSQIGAKQKLEFEEGGYYVNTSITYNPSYLQLPIVALYKFEIGTDLYLYPSAGIYLGYGLGGKVKFDAETNFPGAEISEDDLNFFGKEPGEDEEWSNRFDYGATFGLNLQYSNYTIGLGYDLGLGKINKELESGMKDLKNSNIKITLGYFF
jgi:hypothetical protein